MSDAVVDNGPVLRMLQSFTGEELRQTTKEALKQTGDNFALRVQERVNASPIGGKKATRTMVNDHEAAVSVDVFNRDNLLARIYEGGTYKAAAQGGRMVLKRKGKDLSKPANRGLIRAYRFLEGAYDQHSSDMAADFERIFSNLIEKKAIK